MLNLKSPDFFLIRGKEIDSPQRLLDSLGGVIRIAECIGEVAAFDIAARLGDYLTGCFPEGKIRFALAMFPESKGNIRRNLSDIKQRLQEKERSVRFINREFANPDAGTLFREGIFTKKTAAEVLLLPSDKGQYLAARTVAAQNIHAFAERDYMKPVRDMKTGMLPPKLALILVNLSAVNGNLPLKIWDPFCGSGTILTEAIRMGVGAIGSDFAEKMVEAARKNTAVWDWNQKTEIFLHDATLPAPASVDAEVVVTEGYLGPVFGRPVNDQELDRARSRIEPIYTKFLRQATEKRSLNKMVICLPFWKTDAGQDAFCHRILDAMKGEWKQISFEDGDAATPLRFRRPEQIVGREIFVLERR